MPDYVFAINTDTCIECGQCRRYCPVPGAIIIDENYQHTVLPNICTGCGLCEAFCPVPNTLFKVARAASTSIEAQAVDYMTTLRRVVWRGRWRYHGHPVMYPIMTEARSRLREFLRAYRAGKQKFKVVGIVKP